MTLSELAERLGVAKSSMSRIENGHQQPSADQARALVRILGEPLTELHVLYPDDYPQFDPLAHVEA